MNDPCEYEPTARRAAYEDEAHADAEVIVGANGEWRLCAKCASLPEFAKFKVRRAIKPKEESGGDQMK